MGITDKSEWQKFGERTTTWNYKYNNGGKHLLLECECICWKRRYIYRHHLVSWSSKSCWCIREAGLMWKKYWKYYYQTRPYNIYNSILWRCNRKDNISYYRYWARWIRCLWNNFDEFWGDMWESYEDHVRKFWEADTTIERVNNDGNYCKENCRWATRKEQAKNKSNNKNF